MPYKKRVAYLLKFYFEQDIKMLISVTFRVWYFFYTTFQQSRNEY